MRRWLDVICAAALLAGCGGSPPIGRPSAMPQSRLIQSAMHGKSWMLPEGKREDLLYFSDRARNEVRVFSYPRAKSIGELSLPYTPWGLCSDRSGHVFVVTHDDNNHSFVYEYVHGGSQPISTLANPGRGIGCASDPTTGNLAVTSESDLESSDTGHIAVFQNATGVPTVYSDPNVVDFLLCTYDDSGNLFATGDGNTTIEELPASANQIVEVTINQYMRPVSIQWQNNYLIVSDGPPGARGPLPVYEITVSGSSGSVIWSTELSTKRDKNVDRQLIATEKRIIGFGPDGGSDNRIEYWAWPRGGEPTRTIKLLPNGEDLWGITLSAATH